MDVELKEISQWKKVRPSLNESYTYHEHWKEAIQLFKTRLDRKFFDPLKSIILQNQKLGEGFSIVTVQCALIESLASFRTGYIYKLKIEKNAPSFYYTKSKAMFIDFLHTDLIFINHFYHLNSVNKKILDHPFNAFEFYDSVRCGLMHEARTKGAWHINASSNDDLLGPFIRQEGDKIKLLRTVLHHRLQNSVNQYLTDLQSSTSEGLRLRRLFARKPD